MINDEFMGNISDLNPFDKQTIVEKSVHYFRRHLAVLGKAVRKLKDQNLQEIYTTIESELDLTESVYLKDPDLERFHEAMSAFSVNVLNLQNQVIERLTSDEAIDERVGKDSESGLQPEVSLR